MGHVATTRENLTTGMSTNNFHLVQPIGTKMKNAVCSKQNNTLKKGIPFQNERSTRIATDLEVAKIDHVETYERDEQTNVTNRQSPANQITLL